MHAPVYCFSFLKGFENCVMVCVGTIRMSAREVIVSGTLYESRSSFLTHCLAVPHDKRCVFSSVSSEGVVQSHRATATQRYTQSLTGRDSMKHDIAKPHMRASHSSLERRDLLCVLQELVVLTGHRSPFLFVGSMARFQRNC